MRDKLIEIGAIASAHGIKGQFKVKAFCEDPMALTSYGAVSTKDGRHLSLKAHSHAKGFVLCSATEVTSRNQAESLRGTVLYVTRDAMPEPDSDEFYHADLVGYDVKARDGAIIGPVIGIYDFGAGTILEIKPAGKKALMIPFGDTYQPEVDEKGKCLTMDIAPQWLDDSKPDKG